jgi:hypothetical protein
MNLQKIIRGHLSLLKDYLLIFSVNGGTYLVYNVGENRPKYRLKTL